MKTKLFFFIMLFECIALFAQSSIMIESGAEINIGPGTDICASENGHISGNLTGTGTQCNGPLPVMMASFSANTVNTHDICLRWVTTLEINNSGFEVYRKQQNKDWIKIGWAAGRGNSGAPVQYIYTDRSLDAGTYSYRLKQIDYNGGFEFFELSTAVTIGSPVSFGLAQNYPNPSNPVSKIDYRLAEAGIVTIKVFDITGKEVRVLVNEYENAGYYFVTFDGSELSSGIYFYRLSLEGSEHQFSDTKKMVLIK